MSKPFFSIGMIFKNEIRCLERCLKSLQPLRDAVPCELVMADTGSTDGSREIAAKYADILFDFPWCDDFSAARNAVMDRCSGVWYFSIDADEWLREDITELVVFSQAKAIPEDLAAINIRNYNTVELDETKQYSDFSAIRLLRMSTGVRYTGCIHEKWVTDDGRLKKAAILSNTWLNHDGYAYATMAAVKAKHDRNMALLTKKLAENPEDMQTLVECIDMTRDDDESIEYARKAIEVLHKKPLYWKNFGPVVFRGAVAVAKLHKLPELRDWLKEAMEWFPNSMYTRVDVAYYALADCFDAGEYAEAVRWGDIYQEALTKYRAGDYSRSELLRGAVEYAAAYWERKVFILLSHAYLELEEPEKAYSALQSIQGGELDEQKQVDSIVRIMMRLHRTALLDTPALVSAFWEQINRPTPSEDAAVQRRDAFLSAAAEAFPKAYREEELVRKETLRHGYTLFSALEGKCQLGTAAAILNLDDPMRLEEKLAAVKQWDELPIFALAHALERGARFPISGKPLNIEEMDALASRLARTENGYIPLVLDAAERIDWEDWQGFCWTRGLVLAAVRAYPWNSGEQDKEQGMALVRAFAKLENEFLSRCYTPELLRKERLFLLPPLHRFGWYCAQAFGVLDTGDAAGYVRLLREGLDASEGMKDMVEFLLDNTPELIGSSDEMKAMAEQIRAVLSSFPPDDPAVAALKQSEAYQKVAHLIEQ